MKNYAGEDFQICGYSASCSDLKFMQAMKTALKAKGDEVFLLLSDIYFIFNFRDDFVISNYFRV